MSFEARIAQAIAQMKAEGAKRRKITSNPRDDKDISVGCNEACDIVGEGGTDAYCVKRSFRKERTLFFCNHPDAERFSNGSLKLCLDYTSKQAKDLLPQVKSGQIRQKSR